MSAPPVSGRRSRRRVTMSLATAGVVLAGAALAGLAPGVATASSHREAPLIAADPPVDNTDVYAFVSPDNDKTVTLSANWYPFEEPNGGPNFYPWAQNAHYDINVDSNGDGKPDMTFRWQFHTQDLRDNKTFLYDNGPVTSLDDANLLFRQTYDLTEIRGGHEVKTLVKGGPVAPSDTGPTTMPNYRQLRDQAIYKKDGLKVFAGQAADSFFLDLRVFDLLYGAPKLNEVGQDTLKGYNVNTLSIQVPKDYLALNNNVKDNPVIGVWSDTEKQSTILSPGKAKSVGPYVQVSRLGNPLINEVISASGMKDAFNGSTPNQDAGNTAFVNRVLKPEVPALIEALYGIKAPKTPRTDLLEIFATGIAKAALGGKAPIQVNLNSQLLNKDVNPNKFVPAEELRLNMAVPLAKSPSRLGVLGGDLQGFPNGRRLADDVVDIEIQALEGAVQPDGSAKIVAALAAGDKVDVNPKGFGDHFPYVALPYDQSVNTAGSK